MSDEKGICIGKHLTAEQIAELCKPGEIQVLPVGLQWTTDKPTVPGLYWYRLDDAVKVVHVYRDILHDDLVIEEKTGELSVIVIDGEWAGPLEPPV